MMSLYILDVSDTQLEETISQDPLPVLVQFTASWCGTAKTLAPSLDRLATQYRDQITFLSIDAENYPSTSQKYLIRALPTYLMFKKGQKYDQVIGPDKPQIDTMIQKTLTY